MPKYNALLLEEFEKQIPTGVPVSKLKHIALSPPPKWEEYAKPLQ